ncbi:hypothetical protein DY000_02022234 [Brassica cretica]|uniref:Uncharacterized protein n=1 Tax=Brassica cretica TaxID=69181 RepID=A0ABQ7EES4_BRACR|nr:hypothetical protein DY000_02022234 [Brassica cretica]
MPSSFCFGEEWLLFTHHLSPSLAELINSFSYHASLPTLPLKLETEYREGPSLKPHLTTITLRRYLSSLSTHCTEETPQLTLQASHTRSLLSSFLLPSTSAGSLHDQLAMVLSSFPLPCTSAGSLHDHLAVEHITLTAALKSLIHPFAFSFKYPQITGLPHGLGRRRLVVVILSPASVVDKPGDPTLRVVSYGNRLSVVKIAWSSGSAIDGPDSRIGSMALRYDLMSMECPCRYAGDRGLGQYNLALAAVELVSSGYGRLGLPSLGRSYVLEYFLFLLDLGRILLAQAGYLINGRFPFILRHEKSLGLEDGRRSQTRGQGPGTHGQRPGPGGRDPGLRGGNLDPRGRDLEDGSWRNNMTLFIGLYKLHRIIMLPCRSFSDALALGAGVGRKFDGEAGNIDIKGNASDHTPGACAASVAILSLSSGRTIWFHESCGVVNGSVPRNPERENLGEAKDQEDEEVE